MKTFARYGAALAGLAIVSSSFNAEAQTAQGFALDRFNPSERGSEWFAGDTLDLRGHRRPAIGLVGDFALRPLVIYNKDGSDRAVLVQDQFFLHFGGSMVFWD